QTAIADVEPGFGGEVHHSDDVEHERDGESTRWTIEDVFGTEVIPFAIGHRGYGENKIKLPGRPIENTTKAVQRAFKEGAQIVEVDAVLTGDDIAVALHDDFLEDGTCVNKLDFKDLKHRLKEVSTLRDILKKARKFSYIKKSDRPSGQVVVEIKTPSPLCDPGDETIPALVDAVLDDIEEVDMEEQVIIESFSPEILLEVLVEEPDIPRMLAVSVLQLMTAEQIYYYTGLEAVPIPIEEKNPGNLGLQWAEIGDLYRLPGYTNMDQQYLYVLSATSSHTASLDKEILRSMDKMQGGLAAYFVSALQDNFGWYVLVYTITDTIDASAEEEWYTFASFGVNGMYIDNVPLGLSLEGKIVP
ncbi:MAG: glycerophosphodiester phosphodiesterase, partial [bacterium]